MLGADFVMLGRAFLYGLAALGGRRRDHVFHLLKKETRNNMMQLGVASVNALRHMRKDTVWQTDSVDAPRPHDAAQSRQVLTDVPRF